MSETLSAGEYLVLSKTDTEPGVCVYKVNAANGARQLLASFAKWSMAEAYAATIVREQTPLARRVAAAVMRFLRR